ncbi:MAG: 4Fe-4S binding protein [Spirochaetales bacterium]|nr:4Fe-4S binding protein [Candidatus Physcosoma equi]
MANYSIHFSPAGGTKKTADLIASAFGGYESIDLASRNIDYSLFEFTEDDIVLISFPSFRGRAPETALERLSEMEGNGAKAILNCTYGNRAFEDTLVEMQDTAERLGFRVVCAIASIAEHSIIGEFASDRPDRNDEHLLTFFGKMAYGKIKSGDYSTPDIPGNRPYKNVSYTVVPPMTEDCCTKCGKCIKRCPTGAISKMNPAETDASKCILCTRCIHICPVGAKHFTTENLEATKKKIGEVCAVYKAPELHI